MGFGDHKCITEELGGAFLSLSPEPVASNLCQAVFLQLFQATTNMKQEGEKNTCLHKFEAIEGETRQ